MGLVRRRIARLAQAVCDHRFAAGFTAPEVADDAIGHKDAAFGRGHQVKAHRTTRHLARLRPMCAAHSHFLSGHDDRLPKARMMLTESPPWLYVARVRQLSSLPTLPTGYPQDILTRMVTSYRGRGAVVLQERGQPSAANRPDPEEDD